MYYRISTNAGGVEFYEYLTADSEEKAKAALANMVRNIKYHPDDFIMDENVESRVREANIDECISEEETIHMRDLANYYLQLHHDLDVITVKEYIQLQVATLNNPHIRWLVVKDFNALERQYKFLEKTCNLKKMPTSVYKDTAKKLLLATGTPEYEDIALDICQQYGKEPFQTQSEQDKTCPRNKDKGVIQ